MSENLDLEALRRLGEQREAFELEPAAPIHFEFANALIESWSAIVAALERIPELELTAQTLADDLRTANMVREKAIGEALAEAETQRQRAERVEAAARPVAYADVRICALCQPDRYHEHAANCPVMALRAALADVPAEPSATFTGDYADAAAGYEALADEPDEEGE